MIQFSLFCDYMFMYWVIQLLKSLLRSCLTKHLLHGKTLWLKLKPAPLPPGQLLYILLWHDWLVSLAQEVYFIIYITHLSHMWSQRYAVKVYECRWHPTTYNIPVKSWPYLPNYRSVNNYNDSFFYAPFRTSPILNLWQKNMQKLDYSTKLHYN